MKRSSSGRKLFSRGEWLTLLGMGIVVVSAALTWVNETPKVNDPIGQYVVSLGSYARPGFDVRLGWLRVGWAVVFCGVLCGALLLFNPTAREKKVFLGVQVALSLVILALAVLHIGPHAGVILAIVGASLLLWGAFARYR
ncbi:MAG TPA: hypothetical protein VNJ09_00680 [Chthonomonadales bacterium]|nr:hypothetical protein [Chthonomonadales bacterium]